MLRHLLTTTAVVAVLSGAAFAQQQQESDGGDTQTMTVPIQPAEPQAQDEQTPPAEEQQAQPAQEEQPVQEQAQPATEEPAEQEVTEEQPADAEPAEQEVAEEPAEEEPAEQQAGVAPEETFIPQQEEGLLLANEIMDVTVVDAEGEEIGGINDIILDPEGGIFGAVVSVGGFLGMGAKEVALSWNEFEYSPEEQMATLNVTRAQLEEAPDFQTLADIRAEEEALAQQQQQMQEQPIQPAPAAGQQ